MMLKVVLLFLIGMAVLALFGRLRLPRAGRGGVEKCPRCGRYLIGGGRQCTCDTKGRG